MFSRLPIRGAHIDCRAQMLRYKSIVGVFHDLARWEFNTVLFEYENRFPFTGRLKQAAAEDALTRRQVRELGKLASSLGLRIIPLVHCLAHLEYVLNLPHMKRFAEPPEKGEPLYTVCPSHSGARKLFREMVTQVLDLHPDCRYFHMGGDEAELNPACPRCGDRLRKEGVSRVLVELYADRADWLRSQGPDPIIWSDMPLRHPEAIDALRGHVTIMDWDYWSGTRPANNARIWGAPEADWRKPATWPKVHRELFQDYILTDEGKKARPFPYATFLRDRGFQVIVASAARCAGDNFCAPRRNHVDNVIGAARVASESHLLGSVITSWALRRAPWPLTEYSLIAGAMTMADPRSPRRRIDSRFAEEHFGTTDPGMARIALLLGTPLRGYLDSMPEFDPSTMGWPAKGYEVRRAYARENPREFRSASAKLRANVRRAKALLQKAKPRTPRQRRRVALWHWAARVLWHFAEFAPQMLLEPAASDPAQLRTFRQRAARLRTETARLLKPIYTDRTMRDEQQTRFGTHLDDLDGALSTRGKSR